MGGKGEGQMVGRGGMGVRGSKGEGAKGGYLGAKREGRVVREGGGRKEDKCMRICSNTGRSSAGRLR